MKKLTFLLLLSLFSNDNIGSTRLHYAASFGQTETATALIEKGANPNARGRFNCTPLHYAAGEGHTETATALIEHGADHNTQDHLYRTPLHYAAINGHTKTATILLIYGATQIDNSPDYTAAITEILGRYRGEQTELEEQQYGIIRNLQKLSAIAELKRLYKEHDGNLEAIDRNIRRDCTIPLELKDILLYFLGKAPMQ